MGLLQLLRSGGESPLLRKGRFLDGFAHYATGNIFQKYTSVTGSTAIDPTPPAGRIGPALLLLGQVQKTLDYQTGWVMGFAWRINSSTFQERLVVWPALPNGQFFSLVLETDGTLSMYTSGPSPTFLIANSSPFSIHENTWYYIEVKFSLGGATPISVTATLKVNGTVVASGTQNTNVNQSDTLLNMVAANYFIMSGNIQQNTWIKDLYVFDNTGAHNNDFAGDVTFVTVFPEADVTTQWTPTGGGNSFDQINSNPPNPATFVEDGTAGQYDNFDWQDVPAVFRIVCVQYDVLAQKTAEGTKTMKVLVGPSGAPVLLGPELFVSDTPVFFTFPMDQDPTAGTDWTVPNFNATQFGFKVES